MAGPGLIRRSIAVVTTSRADYGYLRGLALEIRDDPSLELQLLVGGSHLNAAAGHTVADIEADELPIARRIAFTPADDTPAEAVRSLGTAVNGFAEALAALRPDTVVVLGDRYEILAPASACLLMRIPLAHLHGGESSFGALDESVRHAVTKLATWHFPAAEAYRQRILQMGEQPDRVFNLGSPGVDALHREQRLSRRELAVRLGLPLDTPTALVAFHPTTLEPAEATAQLQGLLEALDQSGMPAVITRANDDPGGRAMNTALEQFCAARADRFRLHAHLGSVVFHSALEHLDVLVGNSSSGIIEAPHFHIPVVNIGSRQQGRLRTANVIDCSHASGAVLSALRQAISPAFRHGLAGLKNPYDEHGDGRAAWRIKERLRTLPLEPAVLMKVFRDLPIREVP